MSQSQCACGDCTQAVAHDDGDESNTTLCTACTTAGCGDTGRMDCQRPDFVKPRILGSGYTDCACRDCFDITVSSDMARPELCGDCTEAGCDEEGESECKRKDAYGYEEVDSG